MIELEPDYTRGAVRIFGVVPNGVMTVTRRVAGMANVLVRGGAYTVTASGIVLLDTEAPYSVDLSYLVNVSGLALATRLIQQNLLPTPTFTYGVQGWLPGTGRAMGVFTDPTAHSPVVGHVSSGTSTAPAAVPTYVGHVDSAVGVNAPYTLTPPTTGGTAIATNDQMLLVHQQLSTAATPSIPAGWTLLSQRTAGGLTRTIWSRKRQGADGGVTVSAAAASSSTGTLLWVRGAIDEILLSTPALAPAVDQTSMSTVRKAVLRGHLTVAVMEGVTAASFALPTTGSTTGGGWRYSLGPATGTRSFTIATSSDALAGNTVPTVTTYGGVLTSGAALDVIFQAAGTFPTRVIARAKTTALAAAAEPYLLTGRVRYLTLGLSLWSEITAQGSWANLMATKPTWLDVRGSAATSGGGFSTLFVRIVNPATDVDYVPPTQVLVGAEDEVNRWVDFSAAIPVGTTIPPTAEIQLLHGNQVKEYAADWYLDEFGITPGAQLRDHRTLYWFDGDTPLPTDTPDMLYPGAGWASVTSDAAAVWDGTPGNSTSSLYAASTLSNTSLTYLTLPDDTRVPSEPVLLSDPLDMDQYCWVGLLGIGDLTHPARQAIFQIINRIDPTANSQIRTWETGEFRVITHTLQERERFLRIARPGRVLLWRNPETEYPESNWYLAIGDVTESRLIPNARKQERAWTLPFVRVQSPKSTGSRNAARNDWQDVLDAGDWEQVRDKWGSWLDVMVRQP